MPPTIEVTSVAPKKSRTGLIIAIVVIVLCCCCALMLGVAWNYGDQLMQMLGGTPF
jgi:DNA-binding transcriptional regulator of glucitol operon